MPNGAAGAQSVSPSPGSSGSGNGAGGGFGAAPSSVTSGNGPSSGTSTPPSGYGATSPPSYGSSGGSPPSYGSSGGAAATPTYGSSSTASSTPPASGSSVPGTVTAYNQGQSFGSSQQSNASGTPHVGLGSSLHCLHGPLIQQPPSAEAVQKASRKLAFLTIMWMSCSSNYPRHGNRLSIAGLITRAYASYFVAE